MRFRRLHAIVTALLVALVLLAPEQASGRPAVGLTVGLDSDARLGAPSALHLGLRIDTRRKPSPLSELVLLYPQELGVTTSGLGVDACRLEPDDFTTVIIPGRGLAGCPRNSVMGLGSATGEVRIGTLAIPATAYITLLAGPVSEGMLGLIAYVDGANPFGVKLAYRGSIGPARPPYGGGLSLALLQPPNEFDAIVALTGVTMTLGARSIVYRDPAGRAYRPEGLLLPTRCRADKLTFRAYLTFEDGTKETRRASLDCPKR